MGSATAARILANNTASLQKSLKRLSTGSRIADLQDDAAGAAIAQKHSAQIARINASRNNVSNMISFSQTQDGYMDKVASALERMSELAMLATDNTKSSTDLQLYSKEFKELQSFISDVGDKTFNGTSLFSASTLSVTVGTTDDGTGVKVGLTGADLKSDADYGLARSTTMAVITSALSAHTALVYVQSAISQLSNDRATIGANMSRLESEKTTLSILKDNISQARSRIIDVDVAEESANFARQQILVQSGTAMLAQANMIPQNVLRLIGG
jgi:flagellin